MNLDKADGIDVCPNTINRIPIPLETSNHLSRLLSICLLLISILIF
ncbi:hypothetical protein [Flammeovirga sp. MY04]|nr:hypothetical protein [Flammeovirga sp. MY04]